MGGPALLLLLLQLCLAALVQGQTQCALVLPNVLRVESPETVAVEAFNQNSPIDVEITVYDFPAKKQNLFTSKISLNGDNQYVGTTEITVPSKNLKPESKMKQFVFVIAKCAGHQLEKVVLVSFQSGYIFIQADKTIYTPGSQVYYRMFTMGHKLQPVAKTLIVEFETPEGIIVKRDTVVAGIENKGGIFSQSYKLPEIVNLGTWTIAARYEDSPQQNYTCQFEVKEYMLPSFEVNVMPREPFFYLDAPSLHVDFIARYLYGRPVEGDAFVMFGVVIDGEKKSIPQSLRRVTITDGAGQAELTRKMLEERFENINELLGHCLYISATVLTASGSDMVEAEKSDIRIVTSPYQIDFTKTTTYFKPGMPFELMVFVTNPDGSPARRVPVLANPGRVEGSTQEDGTTRLIINTGANIENLEVNVETNHPLYPPNRQARARMMATAYKAQGATKNYLHIGVTSNNLKAGDNLNVNFNVRNSDLGVQNQIKHFTYMIMSKSKIYKVGRQSRQPGQALVTMTLNIIPDFIPSFRIVAYYYVANEIVADSVWVDVRDTCMGTLEVSGATPRDNAVHEPAKSMRLKVKGDHKAKVGLVIVDKGVYVLNKKYKISQSKVWDSIEKNDIGCTPGSGANNMGVLFDAGLALQTSFGTSTLQRTEPFCPKPGKRRRRSVLLIEHKATKAAKYTGKPRKCCEDGMKENSMGHSCLKRSRYIKDTRECVDAFMDCCQEINKLRAEKRREHLHLARSEVDEGYLSEEDITSRSEFPESWFWKVEELVEAPDGDGLSTKTMQVFLKDSITTWEVLAVSLSEKNGICVADPYEITVMKNYFIDLRLPYSVVRNEQVEIRAVLYNYEDEHDEITVRVTLMYSEKFCSSSTSKKNFQQLVKMRGKTSKSVSFIIVPLEIGSHDIEVKAFFPNYIGDGVKKKLKVVAEGMKMTKTVKVITLDPETKGQGGVQDIKVEATDLKDIVPKTESETIVSVQGNPIVQMVEGATDGAKLGHLIVVPAGCGEQNMITMTPGVIATHFLDNTGQWEKLGVNRRAEAIKLIQQGYTQQLTYRQKDYSYAAWTHRPGSTWLTAYVVKIFSMAYNLIDIQKDMLCGSVKWLILNKQKPDGIFKEDQAVLHQDMVGGYTDAEPEASLTAFVLVAMAESKPICEGQVNSLEGSIQKASDYLLRVYPALTKSYAIAITSYALAMVDRLPKDNRLMQASTGGTHWTVPNNNANSIEATSYALLALIRTKSFEKTAGIMQWLNEQRFYGGVYGSTQVTVMVFQAMAQYVMEAPDQKDLELDVTIKLPGRSKPAVIRINKDNAMVSRTEETKLNRNFDVEVKGTGQGTLTVVTVYNALLSDKDTACKNFDLSVTVKIDNFAKRPEGAKSTALIEICTKYLGPVDSTMTILDISMMTGFSPDIEDLRALSEPVDRYISKFEVNKGLADKGRLIIYLDKVSNKENECLTFKAHQYFEVGLVQPAAVTVYDYYALDSRCTKFYHPEKESGLLNKICQADVCRCAEDNCYMRTLVDEISVDMRFELACAPGVDYVYKAKLTRTEQSSSYDNYMLTILQVIKLGSDEVVNGMVRKFISHQKCRNTMKLEEGKDYLIWGLNSDLWEQQNDFSYIIGKDTWIEWWPNEEECQKNDHVAICEEFVQFAERVMIFGCQS
ncbi:complement C3 [Ambystoma mexicanum]|uniref:complement C3 n=1 Tax=Ambystoma mexicanum TaxID=8296 RepID=UPI0037E76DC3